jgi:adenylate cyclase
LLDRSVELAMKAVAIDPNDSLCQMTLGRAQLHRRSFDIGEPYYWKALELNPGNPEQHAYMGVLNTYLGRIDEALEWFDRAVRLDRFYEPNWVWHIKGIAYFIAGRYDDALAAFGRSATLPAWVRAYLAACHALSGRIDQARAQAAEVMRRMPNFAVQRFVAKEPYRDAAAIERLRDGMLAAGLPILPTAMGGAAPATTIGVAPARRPAGERPSIVVLPFNGDGDVGEHKFFADGITDDLITSLSHTLGLHVIARATAYTYRDSTLGAATAARELEVGYAVHGNIRISAGRIRATAYLVEAAGGTEIWAERFEQPLDDPFAVQDHITTQVLRALQIELLEGEQARVWHRSTKSVEAWGLLTRGMADYKQQTEVKVRQARVLFHRATIVDPNYAAAWAWLGYAYWHEARFHWSDRPEDALNRAAECGEKALALDPQLSEAHAVMGVIRVLRHDFDGAVAAARRAVEISPNGAEVIALLSFVLNWAGGPGEALELAVRASRLCPLHASWYVALVAHAQRLLGQFDDALEAYGDVVGSLPHYIMPRIGLVMCLAEMNRLPEAREQAEQLTRLFPSFPLKRHLETSRYRLEDHNRRRRNALRAAGLPI